MKPKNQIPTLPTEESTVEDDQKTVGEVTSTVEDDQNIVGGKEVQIVALQKAIAEKDATIADLQKAVYERDNKINELQSIIDDQDNALEKTEKVVIADSEKQKIIDAGLIPVLINGKLKGAVTNVFNGVHLDNLSEEDIDELDALGTVFITVD